MRRISTNNRTLESKKDARMNSGIIKSCNRGIFLGVLVLVLFLPLVLNFRLADTFDLAKVTFFRIVVIALVLFWLVKVLKSGEMRLTRSPLNLPAVCFVLVGALATIFSINPHLSFWGLHRYYCWGFSSVVGYVLVYFVVANNSPKDSVKKLFLFAVLAGAIVAFYGICQYKGVEIFSRMPKAPGGRIWSTLGNPNYLGAFLIMVFPLGLGMLLFTKSRLWRLVLVGVLGSFFICLLVTLSRGAWLGLAGSLLLFTVLLRESIPKRLLRLSGLTLIFLLLMVALIFSFVKKGKSQQGLKVFRRISSIVNLADPGIVARVSSWGSSLEMVQKHPLLGTGLDTYYLVFPSYRQLSYLYSSGKDITAGYAHNEFLQAVTTTGILGLAAYLWFWFAFFYVGRKKLRSSTQQEEKIIIASILASGLALLIQNQFSFSVLTTSTYFWLFAGILVAGTGEPKVKTFKINLSSWLRSVLVIVVAAGSLFLMIKAIVPYRADLIYEDGLGYLKAKNQKMAIERIEQAISLNPYIERYNIKLGGIYKDLASTSESQEERKYWLEKAEESYQRNAKMYPQQPYSYLNLGTCYMWQAQMLGWDTVDKAIESLQKALRIDPYFIDAWHNLGRVYGWQGKFDSAIICYKRALTITPKDPALHYGLGFVYADSGNVEEALREWERTLELNPEHEKAKRKLGLMKNVFFKKKIALQNEKKN